PVAYSGLERLALNAGNFGDSVGVLASSAEMPVTLNLGDGPDQVVLGNANSLDGIRFPVMVDGGGGIDSVLLNDLGDANDNGYRITAADVSRNGQTVLQYQAADRLTLRAGGGQDLITVASTAAQTTLLVQAGPGNDVVQLQGFDAPGLAGAVTADGQAGLDTLDYFAYTTDVRVNLRLGTATGAAGGVSNI